MMHRVPVQHLLQHFNLLSPEKKAPSWLNKNLYLSSAKALQPRCLSPSAAESSRISSACDTRCLGGKFNYFPLLDVQFRSAVFFFAKRSPVGKALSASLLRLGSHAAKSPEIRTVFLFPVSSFCPGRTLSHFDVTCLHPFHCQLHFSNQF